jgi:L-alanine-DL-glutamate epimerase-like enolase superfamily enzyme
MKIEAVDLFYLAMPNITTEADGSQDALLVRVAAGGLFGWGECEAAPLPSIAAFVCPMSHGVCRPVGASILGQTLNNPADIARLSRAVAYDSMDLLQAPHTMSGVEMALWDLLGKRRDQPVWQLLGHAKNFPKIPYASLLFGATPSATLELARRWRGDGFQAVKFGWGPIGRATVKHDADHFVAAREGLGKDAIFLVDVGQIFIEDVEAAALRMPALEAAEARWLEEPFVANALGAYSALAKRSANVKLAGGEGAHNQLMAKNLIDYANIGFIQIDCGRIGGIGPAKCIADYARSRGVTFVNHTFTSHLALSASLQPYAGMHEHNICEFPVAAKPLAQAFVKNPIERENNGHISAPTAPGLGITIAPEGVQQYLVDAEIKVNGKVLYRTPTLW